MYLVLYEIGFFVFCVSTILIAEKVVDNESNFLMWFAVGVTKDQAFEFFEPTFDKTEPWGIYRSPREANFVLSDTAIDLWSSMV